MNASSSYHNSGSKLTKIAVVTALHIVLGVALVNMKVLREPLEPTPPLKVTLKTLPPPVIIEPSPVEAPATTEPPPRIFVPHIDIATTTPPEAAVTVTTVAPAIPTAVAVAATPAATPPEVAAEVKPVAKKVFEVASAGNCAVPNYPATSARNGDTGTVGLALLIAPDGRVTDARVTSTSGFRELDRAAIAALSSCKFKPATTNGVPEAAWGKIAYVWTLE